MGVWGCQAPIESVDKGMVYTVASFKTWQLSDTLLWNYAPDRLRTFSAYQDGPEEKLNKQINFNSTDVVHVKSSTTWPISSQPRVENVPPPWLILPEPSYMDINIFIEKLPLEEIAENCYSEKGEIYFTQGERHAVSRYYGIVNGHHPFLPNRPARFMTNSNINLSILTTNIFLLYQLYISDQVEIVDRKGKLRFQWKKIAYTNSANSNRGLRVMPEGLKKDYPILSMIEKPADQTKLPNIPYEVRMTKETILTKIDELRTYEGIYHPNQKLSSYIDYPASLKNGHSENTEFEAYVGSKENRFRDMIRNEIWVVDPDQYFSYMSRDTQRKETDSVVRYEFFSFPTTVVKYYEEMEKVKADRLGGKLKQDCKAKLIYRR